MGRRFYAKLCGLSDRQYLDLRTLILFKQDFKCKDCGKDLSEPNRKGKTVYELSHIIPDLSQTNEQNCEVLCPPCHAAKDPQRRLRGQQGHAWSRMPALENYMPTTAMEGGD